MKVSLITVCFNSVKTIGHTIETVLSQDYDIIEYIIKDGGSTDGTLELLSKYKGQIKVVSKADKGIYDAMNQGLELVSGDVIGIINSDDFFPDNKVISRVVDEFKSSNAGAVYGDLEYVDAEDTDKITRKWKAEAYAKSNFLKGWMPPHPTFFLKKEYYEQFGLFNPDFKSAGDYELMVRMLYKEDVKASYIPHVQMKMRAGGVSNASLKNRIRANKEDRRAWKINGIKPKWYTLWQKPLSKVFQWLS
ncbi:glycosyltransferase family 2 protein [Arcticibacterium luteifluviistationis]|uniref:Glycosyl transferase n=1 Tax=Arcticibacterium luteifluviistationis TaxID=1784714 RepID=A0A2Z4GGW1_9BACT|nr:glycosyltransferase family 2 protein [Arcticibacterium luteifluviistationis]AWW00169.1 glycosyl transferase [Arcticibacterium luteifluviistationis]